VGEVDELLDATRFPQPEDITNHLLDHIIAVAYTPRPGQPPVRYTPETARRTLTFIAERLRNAQTPDLAWWTIPTWIPLTTRTLIALLCRLAAGLMAGLVTGLLFGPVVGFATWTVASIVLPTGSMSASGRPVVLRRMSWRRVLSGTNLVLVLAFGLVAGPALGLVFGLMNGLLDAPSRVLVPQQVWQAHLMAKLMFGLVFGLAIGMRGGLTAGLVCGLAFGLAAVLAGSLVSRVWGCQVYLRVHHRTALQLMRFLEDARARDLLRTVGPIYQFRHATLQDRLAPPDQLQLPATVKSRNTR
jgi:hypothetical protein